MVQKCKKNASQTIKFLIKQMNKTSDITMHPPTRREIRAEREDKRVNLLDKTARLFMASLKSPFAFAMLNVDGFTGLVNSYGAPLRNLSDRQLTEESVKVRMELHKKGLKTHSIARSFALVREASGRITGMRHYGSQLTGGLVLLNGMIAEMETGEGKTLTATLPATTAALAGIPVHIVTVNDYLTARDAELMGPVYKLLGLSVGCITHELRPDERRVAYDSDITYCTNKELTFDYLRDILTLSDMTEPLRLQGESLYAKSSRSSKVLLRGLHYAIIDEADSILIDEARTPLIISATSDSKEEEQFLKEALQIANSLKEGKDFKVDSNNNQILLTKKGEEDIQDKASELGPLWSSPVRQKEIVVLALSAAHFFLLDEHYIIRDNKVQIVDEYTGRVMEDRSWERGLHQLIELKEGCEISGTRETLAKMSYQKFFRRYLHIAGMTGTAKEVKKELLSVYEINTVSVPTNRPVIRKCLSDSIFPKASDKWPFVVERIKELHAKGRPVLVGTRSVAASELVSRLLYDAGLEHQVLNAKNDEEEAAIVERAGEVGKITVSTNMAGRGTDIKPDSESLENGGLHVIITDRYDAARIDRQLAGRCGRQGDPGSYEAILSMEDNVLDGGRAGIAGWFLKRFNIKGAGMWRFLAGIAIIRAQKKIEKVHARVRKDIFKQDMKTEDMLSFAGRPE